jgi:hypothetical protein
LVQSLGLTLRVSAAAAAISDPPPGIGLLESSVTLQWNPVPGATQYRVRLGYTPGGSEYQSDVGTTQQSLTVAVPVGGNPRNLYATLGTYRSGEWVSNTFAYRIGLNPVSGWVLMNNAPKEFPPEGGPDEIAWVLNDGDGKTLDLCVARCGGGYCQCSGEYGDADKVTGCRTPWNGGISTQIVYRSVTDWFRVEFRAGRTVAPGQNAIACTYGRGEHMVEGTLGVYDAMPSISDVKHEGSAVTVSGKHFGVGGTLELCPENQQSGCSAAGITPVSWGDTQITATLNAANVAPGRYDVKVLVGQACWGGVSRRAGLGDRGLGRRDGARWWWVLARLSRGFR